MVQNLFDRLHAAPTPIEVRVEREGAGRRGWRWSLWRGETLLARSPAGFAGAEEAYQAGRAALTQPRTVSSPAATARRL